MKTIHVIIKTIVLSAALALSSAWALSAESFQIERRLQETISTYLEPTEFLVVVRELESKRVYADEGPGATLPGAPGISASDQGAKYRGYFDVDGNLQNAKARPPIQVEVILSRDVPNETKTLLRRVIPAVAGLNRDYGDKVQIKNGTLESPLRQKWESNARAKDNWIESMVKNKKEVSALVLGLLTALAVLILINGLLGAFKERQKGMALASGAKAEEDDKTKAKPLAPTSGAAPAQDGAASSEPAKERALQMNREDLYHKDSAFYEMVEEIRAQAEEHPERVGELVKRWIQEGDVGVRNASILLRNFKFSMVEKVMSKMVASDLDCLQNYLDLEFDFFSEQNERVILEARQELMKIVASNSNHYQVRGMDFLGSLETHVLSELLRDEPVRALVVASVAIPSNRMAEVLKGLPKIKQHEYFVSLVGVDRAEPGEVERLHGHLNKKLQTMNQLLLTEDQKAESIVQLLKNLTEEAQKVQVLGSISNQNRAIFERVRSQVTLFEDVLGLPDRALKILTSDQDPVMVARAWARSDMQTVNRVKAILPKSSQEIFDYEMATRAQVTDEQHATACATLVQKLEQLVFEKVISGYDLNRDAKSAHKDAA